jgi:hypothetical protein
MKRNDLEVLCDWFCKQLYKRAKITVTFDINEKQQISLTVKTLDIEEVKKALRSQFGTAALSLLNRFKINEKEGCIILFVEQKIKDRLEIFIKKTREDMNTQRKKKFDVETRAKTVSLINENGFLGVQAAKQQKRELQNPIKTRFITQDYEVALREYKRLAYINDQIKKIFSHQKMSEHVKKPLIPLMNCFTEFDSKVTILELKELKKQVKVSLEELQKYPDFQEIITSFEKMLSGNRDKEIRLETNVEPGYNPIPTELSCSFMPNK